jgi:hypothetical protein
MSPNVVTIQFNGLKRIFISLLNSAHLFEADSSIGIEYTFGFVQFDGFTVVG